MNTNNTALPTDSQARKDIPLARGCLDYFPAALAEVARLSKAGNDKHNPGEEMHHARGKSGDHADCILRHLAERGIVDTDGFLHDVKVAWRALAMLQERLEEQGAPLARGARVATPVLAWNEGWKCRGCGVTTIDQGFSEDSLNYRITANLNIYCDTPKCYAGMERVG